MAVVFLFLTFSCNPVLSEVWLFNPSFNMCNPQCPPSNAQVYQLSIAA